MGLAFWKPKLLKKQPDPNVFRKRMLVAARRVNVETKARYSRTVRTWKNKPVFVSTISTAGGNITSNTGTDNAIYGYVNNGTSVRYAVMTPDFVSKTEPGIVNSRAGAGGFSHFSFQNPRPGITARRFDVAIAKELKNNVAKILQEEINQAAIDSGQSI